jgi:4-amino-4-deoxy-L-arabinose transferase-like glycosyltransferase
MNRILNISTWLILLIAALLTIITIFRGLILNDEGYIINSAQRILDGQIIYRDFPFAYTPASAYLTALNFILFGNSLFAQRIGTVILTIITSTLAFLLAKKVTKKNHLALLPVLAFLAWGPTHINFPWPVMHSIPIGLAICLCIIKALEFKKTIKYIFTAGILTAALLLFKQNFGGGAILMSLALIFYYKKLRSRNSVIAYLSGFTTILLIYTFYLLITSSLQPFIDIMYEYTVERILLEKALDTPFFYLSTFFKTIAKTAFYLFPLYISLLAMKPLIRHKSVLLVLPVFCIIFYLLGIRPTTDYVHLVPLLAISGLPLLQLLVLTKNKTRKNILLITFIIFIITGFYTAFFTGYYRWQNPLHLHTRYFSDQKIKLWVSPDIEEELNTIKTSVTKYSQGKEDLFVYDYQPMIYYITNKQNPTKFDLLAHNNYFLEEMSNVAVILKHQKIPLIITSKSFEHDKTYLANYIRQNYKRVGESGHFYFWHSKLFKSNRNN